MRALLQRLVDAIRQSRAIDQSMDEARSAVNRALSSLEVAPASAEKDALEDLAEFIVDRKI